MVEAIVPEGQVGVPAKGLFVLAGAGILWCLLYAGAVIALRLTGPAGKEVAETDEPKGTTFIHRLLQSKQFIARSIATVLFLLIVTPLMQDSDNDSGNWNLMGWYGFALVITAACVSTPQAFFMGEGRGFIQHAKYFLFGTPYPDLSDMPEEDKQVGFFTLMPSVFITWIFAKSIRNTASWGGRFGMLGGLAYAGWYSSFFSAGICIYFLRTRCRFQSLPQAIFNCYGTIAVILFQIAVLYRLFNEIWSNASVVAGFYGPTGSQAWWGAAWVSVLIPVIYSVMGGLRSSLFSDVIQAGLGVIFLFAVLLRMYVGGDFADSGHDIFSFEPNYFGRGWEGGWYYAFGAGLIQGCISYPFFDPVLTDRGFLSTPKTMLASFFVGGVFAAMFIFFFAAIGVYGAFYFDKQNIDNSIYTICDISATTFKTCMTTNSGVLQGSMGEASKVAQDTSFPKIVEFLINFIMITASMSTVDSTLAAIAKLISLEFGGWFKLRGDTREIRGPLTPQDAEHLSDVHVTVGRVAICVLMVFGVAFLGMEKDAVKATTVSGTMVMGLGPPIWLLLLWQFKSDGRKGWVCSPFAFILPFFTGVAFGILYQEYPEESGKLGEPFGEPYAYRRLFGTNVIGHCCCIGACLLGFAIDQLVFRRFWDGVPRGDVAPTTVGVSDPKGNGKLTVADI